MSRKYNLLFSSSSIEKVMDLWQVLRYSRNCSLLPLQLKTISWTYLNQQPIPSLNRLFFVKTLISNQSMNTSVDKGLIRDPLTNPLLRLYFFLTKFTIKQIFKSAESSFVRLTFLFFNTFFKKTENVLRRNVAKHIIYTKIH